MKFAIIATGGKQYTIKEGQTFRTEKVDKKAGSAITFDKVLFFSDGKKALAGTPFLKKVTVSGTVVSHGLAKKVTVVKFKAKVRYRRKRGHRQPYTLVKIGKISVAA